MNDGQWMIYNETLHHAVAALLSAVGVKDVNAYTQDRKLYMNYIRQGGDWSEKVTSQGSERQGS